MELEQLYEMIILLAFSLENKLSKYGQVSKLFDGQCEILGTATNLSSTVYIQAFSKTMTTFRVLDE